MAQLQDPRIMNQTSVDLIIHCRWLAKVDRHPSQLNPQDKLWLEHQALVSRNGKIVDILDSSACNRQYVAQFEYHLPQHLIIPGLVNSHTHAAMSLLRGYADDYPLMTWLEQYIWPAENNFVSPKFVETGTQLAICEMLQSGVTCFNDMYFFPEVVTSILEKKGLKGCVSGPIIEFPNPWGQNAQECIDKTTQLVQKYANNDLIHVGYGPHAPYTVTDATFTTIIEAAQNNNTWIHTHLHETQHEVEESIKEHGCRPIERLHKLGFFEAHTQVVHMTQIEDSDLEFLNKKSTHIIHCPESNLKLASGFCPIEAFRRTGFNFGIGTDGAASNNDLDMLGEMKTAALLAKAVDKNAQALPAYAALYGATRGGALAFNLQTTGSLLPDFDADIVAIDMGHLNTQPIYDPIAQLVYAARSHQVSHVWVNGQLQYDHGSFTQFDEHKLQEAVHHWQNLLQAQQGQ